MPRTKRGEPTERVATSIRITPTCRNLWDELARREGLTNTGYLESTIRRLARDRGIAVPEDDPAPALSGSE